ncbi:MAG: hypothetical protein C5B50_13750 [Verrucomicrobia bacterium]|nr:MAG: hypothetical protein C5B50_13750 [Verrucomicrobiota bacterium]
MEPAKSQPESATCCTRRKFLGRAAGLATATILPELPRQSQAVLSAGAGLLPTINLGGHEITRLILGSNPIYGYSHFNHLFKPCLAYKILAAGRRIESPAEIRRCFETAFQNIKPTDAVIAGMYQQWNDQIGENCSTVRENCQRKL